MHLEVLGYISIAKELVQVLQLVLIEFVQILLMVKQMQFVKLTFQLVKLMVLVVLIKVLLVLLFHQLLRDAQTSKV